jgi:hypothetical protein
MVSGDRHSRGDFIAGAGRPKQEQKQLDTSMKTLCCLAAC